MKGPQGLARILDSRILTAPVYLSDHIITMQNNWQIRPMVPQDMQQVLQVERACYPCPWSSDSFRGELDSPVSAVDLLLCGTDLAGYLCSRFVAGELEILNVAVAPEFRRRGVARRLLQHCLEKIRACPLEKAFLEVRVGNAGAIALYRSMGFCDLDLRRGYYADGEDALIMQWRTGARADTFLACL